MVKYIIKRLLLAILILFGVSLIIYFLLRLMPTNIIADNYRISHSNGGVSEEEIEKGLNALLAAYGLEDSSFFGILRGYFLWLGKFLTGDMGESFKYGMAVQDVIGQYMWLSFGISFVALILEMIIAIPLGIKCAVNQYGKLDYIATILCMVGIAFPSFFLGNLFIKWFAVDLGWFQVGGISSGVSPDTGFPYVLDFIWHLILPMSVMVILSIGGLMRYTRTNTLEVLNADYIRTARAKGLSEGKVIYKHVFRNTMIPLVTQLSFTLPSLFGGAMITEQIFALPGIGNQAYQGLIAGDIFLAMGYNMFIAVLTVIGVLFADLMYAVVDPRVKLGS